MANIFDLLGGMSPEQNQGLLAAAAQVLRDSAPSRNPQSFLQTAVGGAAAFQQGVQSMRDRKMFEEQRAVQQQLLDWKLKDAEADFGHQQGVRDREGRIGKRTAALWGSGSPSSVLSSLGLSEDGTSLQPPMASAMPGAGQNSSKVGGPDWLQNWQMQNRMPGPSGARGQSGAPSAFGLSFGLGLPLDIPRMQSMAPQGGLPPAMAPRAGRPNQTQMLLQNMMSEAQIRFEEGDKAGAEKLLDMIQKFRPTATWKEVTQGNRVVNQAFFDNGEEGEMSNSPVAAKLHFQNVGPHTKGVDAYTGEERVRYQNGMSPSDQVSIENSMRADRRARDANDIAAGRKVIDTSTGLRKEFDDLPEVRSYKKALPAFTAIEGAVKRNTTQSDINIVYGLAKLYDPDSVVREGEYATVANSPNVPERVKGWVQYVAGGGRLTPQVKNEIMAEARGRMKSYEDPYTAARQNFTTISQNSGADPSLIFPSEHRSPTARKGPTHKSAMKGQVMDGYRFKGGNPADPNAWEKL